MWLCAVILRVTIDLSNLLQRMKKIISGLLSLNINRFLSIQHWYVCWFIEIWHGILRSKRLCLQTSKQLSRMNKSTALVWSPLLYVKKKLRLGVFILWVFMKFYVVFLCRLFWGCWNHPISQHSQRMGATDTWQTLTWHSMKYWLVV